jgi:putative ABC transport system permease protein
MNITESIWVALRGLSANKLRSGLTMLGIIIGVAAVIALLSIGQGAQAQITSRIQGIGSNVIFIMPGAMRQEGGVRSAVGSAASLTQEDAEAIAGSPDAPSVAVVAPVSQQRSQVVYSGQNINTSIQGVTPEYAVVRNWAVEDGRFIEKSDVDSRSRVAVLGSSAAQELFGTADPLGQSIKIQQAPYRVIGVMESKGGASMMGGRRGRYNFYSPYHGPGTPPARPHHSGYRPCGLDHLCFGY